MTDRAELLDDRGSPPVDDVQGLRIGRRHAAGYVELARPERRNALTREMRRAFAAAYPAFARDPMIYAMVVRSALAHVFSAGADLAELVALAHGDRAQLRQAVADALSACWQHECFSKPTIALIDGIVMGAGAGISLFGTHRVAGKRFSFSSPETGIGLAPSNGQSYVLARMPDAIGMYLALTGEAIGRKDAFRLGLATHCIDAVHFDGIEQRLADADPVDAVLDGLHRDPEPGGLAGLEAAIRRCFSAASVENIIARLEAERGDGAAWARKTAAGLRRRSPLALKVAHRLLEAARGLDLRDTLQLEYRVMCRMIEAHDFRVGAGAVLSRNAAAPVWEPQRLEDAADALVAQVLAPAADLVLTLPERPYVRARPI
jgi:enoyl-CoA hydratase